MKLTLTKNEVSAIIIGRLGVPSNTEIVIDDNSLMTKTPLATPVTNNLSVDIELVMTMVFQSFNRPDQKILGIKAIRILFPVYGLAESKFIMENFLDFVSFVRSYGNLPRIVEGRFVK